MENEDSLIIAIIHLDSSIEREDGIISSEVLDVFIMCVLTSHDLKQHPVSRDIVTNIPYEGRTLAAIRSIPQK